MTLVHLRPRMEALGQKNRLFGASDESCYEKGRNSETKRAIYDTGVWEVPFLVLPHFCDQFVFMPADKFWTGKRNPKIVLDIVWEKCIRRVYILSSDGFHELHTGVV